MYSFFPLAEYQGNPLIEALPIIQDDVSLYEQFTVSQYCNPSERALPPHIRRKFLSRINNFIQPNCFFLEIFRAIEDAIFESYIPKNPLSTSTQHWLHYLKYDEMEIIPKGGILVGRSRGISIIGPSGIGKSTLLDRALAQYPQVIEHSNYKNEKICIKQIVWIKIDCPENLSITGLLTSILAEFDKITGSEDAMRSMRGASSIAKTSCEIERKFRIHFVGLLVIEEIQNLSIERKDARDQLMQFILNLMNRSGVPIVFVGNPEIKSLLQQKLKIARRAESGGVFLMDDIVGEEWDIFVEHLWRYQWTNPPTPYSAEFAKILGDLSTNIPDFAVRIFRKSQELLIGSENEKITPAALREAYGKACELSTIALQQRASYIANKSVPTIPDTFISDELKNMEENEKANKRQSRINQADQIPFNNSKTYIIPDINTIHHSELKSKIEAFRRDSCRYPSKIDPTVIQSCSASNNMMEELIASGLMLKDSPLFLGR